MELVNQIRKELEPHCVEGFTAFCYPMPTMHQVNQLLAAVESLTAEKEASEEELVSTATGLLPDCMMPDGGNGPCSAYREQLRLVESLAGISVQWSEQMCTERVGRKAAESSLAQAREEIALLRIQKGQLEDREEAAEQREKGLRELVGPVLDEYLAVIDGGTIPEAGEVTGNVCSRNPYRDHVSFCLSQVKGVPSGS